MKAAAVAIEIFHKASLVNDDIEDQDLMRYGRPTLHVEHGIVGARCLQDLADPGRGELEQEGADFSLGRAHQGAQIVGRH